MRRIAGGVCTALLACLLSVVGLAAPSLAAITVCGPSAGATLCLKIPSGPLSGEQTISAVWSGTARSYTVEFRFAGSYLNYEYQSPYSFIWPTDKSLDGTYRLRARVHEGGIEGEYVSTMVHLVNGNMASIPRSPANFRALFRPRAGSTTIAAVGNAGAEKTDELNLERYIESTSPTAFLYLGEVHEFGTWASRRDHYGLAAFDDPQGRGTLWGRMARYTLATPGNHERDYITEYRDYWHERPLWSTTVIDGVRIYDLTSECGANGGCRVAGAQAQWLKSRLATDSERCTLSFWHRPVVSMDSARSGPIMNVIWHMLARSGADLVLNADTREMEELAPMNSHLQTGRPYSHMVELVSGAAAARWVISHTSDRRVAWHRYKTPGAVYVHRQAHTLQWRFRDSKGTLLRSGHVHC